eukprot:NODE_37_length_35953_cov_1.028037.p14 type:complete len:112 gc:universal NODE_37_length_35953_cov_1.028037:2817-2482(-)
MAGGRLYAHSKLISFRRGKHNLHEHTALLRIENANTREDSEFYLGKRAVIVYHAKTAARGRDGKISKKRTVWGKITGLHGNGGVVRAKFAKNVNPEWFGKEVRVLLYPSQI